MKKLLREWVVLLTAGALLLAWSLAGAHAGLERSAPADGSTVQSAPATLELIFTAPVRLTSVKLRPDDGAPIAVDVGRREPGRRFSLTAPELSAGGYTLDWRALAEDGHAMSGSIGFTIEAGN